MKSLKIFFSSGFPLFVPCDIGTVTFAGACVFNIYRERSWLCFVRSRCGMTHGICKKRRVAENHAVSSAGVAGVAGALLLRVVFLLVSYVRTNEPLRGAIRGAVVVVSALTIADDGDDVRRKKQEVFSARRFFKRRNCGRKRKREREDKWREKERDSFLFFFLPCTSLKENYYKLL